MSEAAQGINDVLVSSRVQEKKVPEYNDFEKLNGVLRFFGKITSEGRLKKHLEGVSDYERPTSLRVTRAQLFKDVLKNKDDASFKRGILAEAHERDEIALQYLKQGEIRVNLPGLGEQMARYTTINPVNLKEQAETDNKAPIFLIPGISNDIDCVGALVQEIPYQGRKVITAGFPESFLGKATQEFAQAVETSANYEPHVAFYKKAIEALLKKNTRFDLWGFSTGAAISAGILQDPEFKKRINNLTLICPAGATDQTDKEFKSGILQERIRVFSSINSLGRYTYTDEWKNPTGQDREKFRIRKSVFDSLFKKVSKKCDWYNDMNLDSFGKITVVMGEKDEMTKGYRAKSDFMHNPQVDVIDLPKAFHSTPIMEPKEIVAKILNSQR